MKTPAPLKDINADDLPRSVDEEEEVKQLPVRNLVGKLWWLANISRPDISLALHKCATWQNRPSWALWKRLLHILKYLSGTPKLGLIFKRLKEGEPVLAAQCDASFAAEPGSKSRYGWLFTAGGGLVAWDTKVIKRIVSSSTEAECNGLIAVGKENVWQREFHQVLGYWNNLGPTQVAQDNTAAINLATGAKIHKRSKHFRIEFDLFKEYVETGEMTVIYKPTVELAADLLTKSLPAEQFIKLRDSIMGSAGEQRHFDGKTRKFAVTFKT